MGLSARVLQSGPLPMGTEAPNTRPGRAALPEVGARWMQGFVLSPPWLPDLLCLGGCGGAFLAATPQWAWLPLLHSADTPPDVCCCACKLWGAHGPAAGILLRLADSRVILTGFPCPGLLSC